jgi:ubiquinol-cytochrome c reductase iron-sulfur subunit
MPALTSSAGTLVRSSLSQRLPALRASATALTHQRRCDSTAAGTRWETTKIPSFGKYKSKGKEEDNRVFGYVMAGSLGAITAMGAKATVVGMYYQTAQSAASRLKIGSKWLILVRDRLFGQHVGVKGRFGHGKG